MPSHYTNGPRYRIERTPATVKLDLANADVQLLQLALGMLSSSLVDGEESTAGGGTLFWRVEDMREALAKISTEAWGREEPIF